MPQIGISFYAGGIDDLVRKKASELSGIPEGDIEIVIDQHVQVFAFHKDKKTPLLDMTQVKPKGTG